MKRRVARQVSLPVAVADAYDAVDPYLREFAAFATDLYRTDVGSSLGLWALDPKVGVEKDINIGVNFASPTQLAVAATAPSNTAYFADSTASPLLELAFTVLDVLGRGYVIDAKIPVVCGALSSDITALTTVGTPISNSGIGRDRTVLTGGVYAAANIASDAITRFDASVAPAYQLATLNITTRGAVVIHGDVTIHVAGDVTIQNGGILALGDDDARLTLLVDGDFIVDNATIGVPLALAQSGRGIADMTEWVNPDRIRIVHVRVPDGGDPNPNWWISNGASVVANLHGAMADFQLSNATLAGRVTAGDVVLAIGGQLLYSPSLNPGVGFTSPGSPLFASPGSVTSGVAGVLNAALPADGLVAYEAALRGVPISGSTTVMSKRIDADAAEIENRESLADAAAD